MRPCRDLCNLGGALSSGARRAVRVQLTSSRPGVDATNNVPPNTLIMSRDLSTADGDRTEPELRGRRGAGDGVWETRVLLRLHGGAYTLSVRLWVCVRPST